MSVSSQDFAFIQNLVRKESAIVVESSKEYLVEARLEPLAREEGLESIAAIVAQLRAQPHSSLARRLVDAMTTNETSFFRDLSPFEYVRTEALPDLIKRRAESRRLRIWCAAASSGQEPYSLAMLIKENFQELDGWELDFVASDYSETMLQRSRSGVYSQVEVNRGLPASKLVRFFKQKGRHWMLKDEIRNLVNFRQINLIGPWPPLGQVDLIFVRNVLIYFDVETKREILAKMKSILAPDGYLFLGASETTLNINEAFKRFPFNGGACYRLIDP